MLYQILIASTIGSIFALIGGFILLTKENLARKFSLVLVSFAAGSLLGATFFELLPEALERGDEKTIPVFVLGGILLLFCIEKMLRWYHCHDQETCDIHVFSGSVIFGDTIHNFLDGIIIALSFSLNVASGIATSIAVFFHEIPQEIGDFGVLLHAGYSKRKVLWYNLLSALATMIGALLGYVALPLISPALPYLVAVASGIFMYIAISDLIPELRHKTKEPDVLHFFVLLLGLYSIWYINTIFHE